LISLFFAARYMRDIKVVDLPPADEVSNSSAHGHTDHHQQQPQKLSKQLASTFDGHSSAGINQRNQHRQRQPGIEMTSHPTHNRKPASKRTASNGHNYISVSNASEHGTMLSPMSTPTKNSQGRHSSNRHTFDDSEHRNSSTDELHSVNSKDDLIVDEGKTRKERFERYLQKSSNSSDSPTRSDVDIIVSSRRSDDARAGATDRVECNDDSLDSIEFSNLHAEMGGDLDLSGNMDGDVEAPPPRHRHTTTSREAGSGYSQDGMAPALDAQVTQTDLPADVQAYIPAKQHPYALMCELFQMKTFWKFTLFTLFLINLKSIFRHLDATLPTYLIRTFGNNVKKGTIYSINPFMIMFLTPVVAAVSSKYDNYDMIKYGGYITGLSPFFLAAFNQMWAVILFVVVLSLGEAIWSPRVYDYTISVAPEVSSAGHVWLYYCWW
jgi:hypothetical protein